MRIGAIIQNRFLSTRMPYKCMFKFPNGDTLLEQVIKEAKKIRLVDEFIIAFPKEQLPNEVLNFKYSLSNKYNISCFTDYVSDVSDVLSRFKNVAEDFNLDYILRVTADDPFRNPQIAEDAIRTALISNTDYVRLETSCVGEGCEVISRRLLEVASKLSPDREHITNFIDAYTCNAMELQVPSIHIGYSKLSVDTNPDWIECNKRWKELNDARSDK